MAQEGVCTEGKLVIKKDRRSLRLPGIGKLVMASIIFLLMRYPSEVLVR